MKRAVLVLEDGESFEGLAFGSEGNGFGEVVFNTGMTGYQEVLTDPSYDGQIVTMTYPHAGNYGTNDEDVESARPRVAGFVVRDLPPRWSSWRGRQSLEDYLLEWDIPGITEVDTRRLTRHIRDRGAMRGAIAVDDVDPVTVRERVMEHPSMTGLDLVGNVTTDRPYTWPSLDEVAPPGAPGARGFRFRVAAYDFGIKFNILRNLAASGCEVTVYPAFTPPAEILEGSFDGVFLSNGPGDPEAVGYGIAAIRTLLGKVPIFGICLGHQLLAHAVGLSTFKLPFGHRGINHPVARLDAHGDTAIEITTQNHGFAVSPQPFGFSPPAGPGSPLPRGAAAPSDFGPVELTHINLNDYTVEGFRLRDVPAFCVQYHPEAGPGPRDARYLFDMFCSLMEGGIDGTR